MKYTVIGDNFQIVNVELAAGEKMWSEAGSMVFKSANMGIKAEMREGLKSAFKRMFAGETFFVAEFTPTEGKGVVGFGSSLPGKIKVVELKAGQSIIAERGAFLAAESGVTLDTLLIKKPAAAIFGGEGFIMQKLTGPGTVFINIFGDLINYDLKKGQVLEIAAGHVAAYEPSVKYDIEYIGDIKTAVFGGSGLMLAKLEGPGKVTLQTMTKDKFINEMGLATKADCNKGGGGGGGANIKVGGFSFGLGR